MINNKIPKVSTILATYNRAHCLSRSIKSVLEQTYKDFELIVVDDCSQDNTGEVIRSFDDSRIKYIRLDKNKGASGARNAGIIASKGDFIAFQDSDDEWLPEKLEKQISALENAPAEYGAVYSGYWVFWPGKKEYMPKTKRAKSGDIFANILEGCFFGPQTILIKKKCFLETGIFDEQLPSLEDWELFIRFSKKYHFYYIREPLVNVFPDSGGVSSNFEARSIATEMILNKYSEELREHKILFSKFLYGIGVNFCHIGEIKKGRKHLYEAVKRCPFNIKYLVTIFPSLFNQNIYKKLRNIYDSSIK